MTLASLDFSTIPAPPSPQEHYRSAALMPPPPPPPPPPAHQSKHHHHHYNSVPPPQSHTYHPNDHYGNHQHHNHQHHASYYHNHHNHHLIPEYFHHGSSSSSSHDHGRRHQPTMVTESPVPYNTHPTTGYSKTVSFDETMDGNDDNSITNKNNHNDKHHRRVSLHPTVTVHKVLHYKDYTTEEVQNSFYRRPELKLIRTSYRDILIQYGSEQQGGSSSGNSNNRGGVLSTGCCIRGLEGKTPYGHERKAHKRRVARDAVLWEQQRQRHLGMSDQDLVADLYFECSEGAQVDAYLAGLKDEQEAIRCRMTMGSSTNDKHGSRHKHDHEDMDVDVAPSLSTSSSSSSSSSCSVSSSSAVRSNKRTKVSQFQFSSATTSTSETKGPRMTSLLDDANDENMIPTSPIQVSTNKKATGTASKQTNTRRNSSSIKNSDIKSILSYTVCQSWPPSMNS